MQKVKFNYLKKGKEEPEEKEVIVLKENAEYVEGIECGNESDEKKYQEIMSKYRKFRKDRIKNAQINLATNEEMIKTLEKKIQYYQNLDFSNVSEQTKNQIDEEFKIIYSHLENIVILLK